MKFMQRSALFTAAAVTGVVLAGTTVVGASLALLEAGDDDAVGQLDLVDSGDPVTDVTLSSTTSTTDSTTSTTSAALLAADDPTIVDLGAAGTVTLHRDGSTVVVDSLDPAPGWTAVERPTDDDEIRIDLAGDGRELKLTAKVRDGGIEVELEDESSPVTVTSPPNTATGPTSTVRSHDDSDDDHGDDHGEDDGDDDHDDDDGDEEYEGHDDDD